MTTAARRPPPPAAATLRKRRQRERERDGGFRITLMIGFDLVDALETCGFAPAGIESREEAEAAVQQFLDQWQAGVDRLAPHVTRDTLRPGAGLNCHINSEEPDVRTDSRRRPHRPPS